MKRWQACAILVVGCSSRSSAPAGGSGSAVAAPLPDAMLATPVDAAVAVTDATPATTPVGPALDPRVVTRTSFGPIRKGETVTKQLLADRFGRKFEDELASFDESGEGEDSPAAWVHLGGEDAGYAVWLRVDQDGMRWKTSSSHFRDEHGIGPGTTTAKLVATIKDLSCINIEAEEPEFECWSKSAPELRYSGQHGYKLDTGFTLKKLAKTKLHVGALEWRPAADWPR